MKTADQRRRIDAAHTAAVDGTGPQPGFYVPEFDGDTKSIHFGANEDQLPLWDEDPTRTKVLLDKIIVCPQCEAVPTFRRGCGACGSAWVEQEVLLHHYACAHVGPESDFGRSNNLVCPKCRLDGLVAGSDFERTDGCHRCVDCNAVFTQVKMIGHCLSCQHRFAADDGLVKEIYGYHVGGSSPAVTVPAPNILSTARRTDPALTPSFRD